MRTSIGLAAKEAAVLLGYGVLGWVVAAAGLCATLWTAQPKSAAFAVHTVAATIAFALVSFAYFQRRTAFAPFVAALAFGGAVLALDIALGVAFVAFEREFDARDHLLASGLPAYCATITSWAIGLAMSRAAIPHRRLT